MNEEPQGLIGQISPLEMLLEEPRIQPLARNLHQQILGAQEPATSVNFPPQPLDQRAELPRLDLLLKLRIGPARRGKLT